MSTLKSQKARKRYECCRCKAVITSGEVYLRFSLTRFSPIQIRCVNCRPPRSERTTSDFLAEMYSIKDNTIGTLTVADLTGIGVDAVISDIIESLNSLKEETQERLDNMPEHLQDSSSSGELLQGRIEAIDDMVDELEGVNIDIDDNLEDEELEERFGEILDEIQQIGYPGS